MPGLTFQKPRQQFLQAANREPQASPFLCFRSFVMRQSDSFPHRETAGFYLTLKAGALVARRVCLVLAVGSGAAAYAGDATSELVCTVACDDSFVCAADRAALEEVMAKIEIHKCRGAAEQIPVNINAQGKIRGNNNGGGNNTGERAIRGRVSWREIMQN
jgi:hypothetical protein